MNRSHQMASTKYLAIEAYRPPYSGKGPSIYYVSHSLDCFWPTYPLCQYKYCTPYSGWLTPIKTTPSPSTKWWTSSYTSATLGKRPSMYYVSINLDWCWPTHYVNISSSTLLHINTTGHFLNPPSLFVDVIYGWSPCDHSFITYLSTVHSWFSDIFGLQKNCH